MKKIMRILITAVLLCTMAMTVSAAGKTGFVVEKGKTHYYKDGEKVVNKLGIRIGGKYYRIGKYGAVTEVKETEGLAGIFAEKNGRSLKKCFNKIAAMEYKAPGVTGARNLANYGFRNKKGDCKVQAQCFVFVAKVLGYDQATFKSGYVKTVQSSGGYGKHAWATINIDGVNYVYDPSLAGYLKDHGISTNYAFKFRYGAKNTYNYFNRKKKPVKS